MLVCIQQICSTQCQRKLQRHRNNKNPMHRQQENQSNKQINSIKFFLFDKHPSKVYNTLGVWLISLYARECNSLK